MLNKQVRESLSIASIIVGIISFFVAVGAIENGHFQLGIIITLVGVLLILLALPNLELEQDTEQQTP